MNNIVIHGRLTRDPEQKTYTNSKGEHGSMTTFSVAVNRRFGEETDFFNCACFGKSGENVARYFRKGDGIVCSGEMQSSKGKKDETKTYWNLLVQNWDFAEKKGDGASGARTNYNGAPTRAPESENDAPLSAPTDSWEQIDEDIPF